jgi:hypothetical protein
VQSLEPGRKAFGVSVHRQLSCKPVREARTKAAETHATSDPAKASMGVKAARNRDQLHTDLLSRVCTEIWAASMTMISKSRKWADPRPISGAGKSSECARPRVVPINSDHRLFFPLRTQVTTSRWEKADSLAAAR